MDTNNTNNNVEAAAQASGKKRSYNKFSIAAGMQSFFSNNMATGIQPNYGNVFRKVVLGIPSVWLGIMNTIVGVLNIIGIPLGAIIMQKIKLPWGKFRSWLYAAGGLYAFFLAVEFVDFGLPDGVFKYLVAIIPYLMVNFIMTLHVTATRCVLPLYAPELHDRAANASASATIGAVGKIIYSLLGLKFITMINDRSGSDALGYTVLAFILSFGFVLAVWHYGKILRPLDPSAKDIKAEEARTGVVHKDTTEPGFWAMLKSIINLPFGLMLCSGIGKSIAMQLINNLCGFYYLYVIGDKTLMATYLTLSAVFSYLGAQFCNLVAHKMELKYTAALGLAVYGGCLLAGYLAGSNALIFTILLSISNIGLQIYLTSETPLYTAISDYSYLKTGKDSSKFIQQFSGLSNKTGTLVSTSVVGFGLAIIGFDEKNVTDAAVQGLRILISLGPAIICAIGMVCILCLPLTSKKLAAMKAEAAKSDAEKKE